jgi:hypothetical protein
VGSSKDSTNYPNDNVDNFDPSTVSADQAEAYKETGNCKALYWLIMNAKEDSDMKIADLHHEIHGLAEFAFGDDARDSDVLRASEESNNNVNDNTGKRPSRYGHDIEKDHKTPFLQQFAWLESVSEKTALIHDVDNVTGANSLHPQTAHHKKLTIAHNHLKMLHEKKQQSLVEQGLTNANDDGDEPESEVTRTIREAGITRSEITRGSRKSPGGVKYFPGLPFHSMPEDVLKDRLNYFRDRNTKEAAEELYEIFEEEQAKSLKILGGLGEELRGKLERAIVLEEKIEKEEVEDEIKRRTTLEHADQEQVEGDGSTAEGDETVDELYEREKEFAVEEYLSEKEKFENKLAEELKLKDESNARFQKQLEEELRSAYRMKELNLVKLCESKISRLSEGLALSVEYQGELELEIADRDKEKEHEDEQRQEEQITEIVEQAKRERQEAIDLIQKEMEEERNELLKRQRELEDQVDTQKGELETQKGELATQRKSGTQKGESETQRLNERIEELEALRRSERRALDLEATRLSHRAL